MNITKAITTLTLLLTLTVAVSAQAVYVLRADGPTRRSAEGFYLPSPAYHFGENASNPRVPRLRLPHFSKGSFAPSAMIPGQGGLAVDQASATMISSDGFRIWEEFHPRYNSGASLKPVPAPALSGGPIMGLTTDGTHNRLWMCDSNVFQAREITWPYRPNDYIRTPAFVHDPFTGIAFDPTDNTLWLSDISGCVYHVDTTGGPIGTQPVAVVPALLKGITVNRSTGPGAWINECSNLRGGFRIIVTDGNNIIDALSGESLPLASSRDTYGLAYSSDAQYLSGKTAGTGSTRIVRPFTLGVGNVAIVLEGAQPLRRAYLLFGHCPLFPGISFSSSGGGGHMRVTRAIMRSTNPVGTATVDIPAGVLPLGFELTLQWVYLDATLGIYRLTDAMSMKNSLL